MEYKIRKILSGWTCIVGLFILGASDTLAAVPGECLTDDEAALLSLIDQYRVDNSVPKVPWSKSLTTVAQWHVIDATQNEDEIFTSECNSHSWSNMHPELWNAVCYTRDHAEQAKMWSKPSEITGGIYSSNGFEVAGSGYESISAALAGWQNSFGHNEVILNQGIWANYPWKAMGVGVDLQSRYYFVWFSTAIDSQGEVQPCSEISLFTALFSHSFE